MHEVRVYDSSGNLKRIISEKALTKRSERLMNFPSAYRKGGKKVKPQTKVATKVGAKVKS